MSHGTLRPGVVDWAAVKPGWRPFGDVHPGDSVGARFAEVAERRPDHPAIVSPSGTWTYRELHALVLALAARIRASAPAERVPVAVLAAHDGPLVAAMLAVIAAGHIVVVLDPTSPGAQLGHVLDECRPAVLLHDANHASTAGELCAGRSMARIDLDTRLPPPAPDSQPSPSRLDDPLMLAFTSGTSGAPKGAIITHGVLMNLVRGATDALGIGPDDRMPMLFPTSLAVAAYPMFLPLLNGGTLATLDVRGQGLAPIPEFLIRERITLAYLAPTVVRFLVDALAGYTFPDLRMIALGGEVVDREVAELAARLFDPTHLANGYGTTETGVIALYVIAPDDIAEVVPTGHPVPEVELTVVDDAGAPVPQGEPGEIVVASPHVFRGYWGHPELNRAVIAADPQGRRGWSSYRTGDYGHIATDGALVVAGRLDTKVKVRGRFVVLGDVEMAVQQLTDVSAAAVTSRRVDGITDLIAYVVPDDSGFDPVAARSTLLVSHEAFEVPSRWVVLDEFPRLPNGKVDRRSLPDPDLFTGAGRPAGGSVDPQPAANRPDASGTRERRDAAMLRTQLTDIWQRLLPVGSMTVDEDFFDLGGDSLLAAQMLIDVEHRLGVRVPMGELVGARTIRTLAAVIGRLDSDGPSTSTVACLQRGTLDRPRLWFVHDLHGSAFRVRHLAEALGPEQGVWSFESPLLGGIPNPATDLATFAARYATDLVRAQPSGPYYLAGYSFGGICAYEIARQLTRDGHEVAFTGVVDVGPGYRGVAWGGRTAPLRPWFGVAPPPDPDLPLTERLRAYATMASSPARLARHLSVRTGVAAAVDPLRFRNDLRTHGTVRPEWRLWYAWNEHWRLAAKHWNRTSPYRGRIDLFWADDTPSADSTMGWKPLVDQVVIHRCAGAPGGPPGPGGAPPRAAALAGALEGAVARRD